MEANLAEIMKGVKLVTQPPSYSLISVITTIFKHYVISSQVFIDCHVISSQILTEHGLCP